MKKIAILTCMLCSYGALHAESSCCGKKEKTVPSKNIEQIKKEPTSNIMKTATGLEYTILTPATSSIQPKAGSLVTVHYTGWLNDNGKEGKKFDSSVDRGKTFQFHIGVGQVIKGWDEGVMGMKVGEKRRLYIPAALGYGARGAGTIIPGNSDLIFDVELIDVSK